MGLEHVLQKEIKKKKKKKQAIYEKLHFRSDFHLGLFFHFEIWRLRLTVDENANQYYFL